MLYHPRVKNDNHEMSITGPTGSQTLTSNSNHNKMSDVRDDNFADYRARLARQIADEAVGDASLELTPAGKFENGRPKVYPGYTVITSPYDDESDGENRRTYEALTRVQEGLATQINSPMFVPVAVPSFHLTVADLISGNAFAKKQKIEGWESELRETLRQVFEREQCLVRIPPRLLVSGLCLFSSVIVAAVSSEDEFGYHQLLRFRDLVYDDSRLQALGIERPRYSFTGHITIGYVEARPSPDSAALVARVISQINQREFLKALSFKVTQVELRKFENMSHYYRHTDWPILRFVPDHEKN